jgi:hypothetical protein
MYCSSSPKAYFSIIFWVLSMDFFFFCIYN